MIHIPQLFPNLPHAVTVQENWSSFFALYQELTKAPKKEVTVAEVEEFQANAHAWVQKFLTVYQAKKRHTICARTSKPCFRISATLWQSGSLQSARP